MLWKTITKSTLIFLGFSLSACLSTETALDTPTPDTIDDAATPVAVVAAENNPTVTSSFGGGGLNWSEGGGLRYRFTAIERNGEIYICGAYTGRGTTLSRKFSREAMRFAKVTANEQTVLRNLRYFYEASNAGWDDSLVGSQTRCNSTGNPAGSIALDAFRVELRQGRYRIRA